jgi:hypothetical protein
MKLGFNTSGNLQTTNRTTNSVVLGKLRNTIASTTRKFKYCNARSPDLNVTFKCVFNGVERPILEKEYANTYHVFNEILPDDEIPQE